MYSTVVVCCGYVAWSIKYWIFVESALWCTVIHPHFILFSFASSHLNMFVALHSWRQLIKWLTTYTWILGHLAVYSRGTVLSFFVNAFVETAPMTSSGRLFQSVNHTISKEIVLRLLFWHQAWTASENGPSNSWEAWKINLKDLFYKAQSKIYIFQPCLWFFFASQVTPTEPSPCDISLNIVFDHFLSQNIFFEPRAPCYRCIFLDSRYKMINFLLATPTEIY